ncbi:MAG: class I SAM-dependent methyltransferase [Promethearchaeota archaeon]
MITSEKLGIGNKSIEDFDKNFQNLMEWEARAQREGYKKVMSTRWTQKQCVEITKDIEIVISKILNKYLKSDIILDIGCGIGRFFPVLSKFSKKFYGLDISPIMLKYAKKKSEDLDAEIILKRANICSNQFEDNSIDLSFSFTLLMHIVDNDDFIQAVNEIKRITNPKGLILICDELSNTNKTRRISLFSILRSINNIKEYFKPWSLIDSYKFQCITDTYTIMIFKLLET